MVIEVDKSNRSDGSTKDRKNFGSVDERCTVMAADCPAINRYMGMEEVPDISQHRAVEDAGAVRSRVRLCAE